MTAKTQTKTKKSLKVRDPILCLVCNGTRRTCIRYGALACMACASFFRTTVSFGIQFLCNASDNCAVSNEVKSMCRSCRFDKCIKAGMRRELIRQKRDDVRVPKVEQSPQSNRSSSLTPSDEFNAILNVSNDELLQYYVKQIKMAAMKRDRNFDEDEDTREQFLGFKRVNDKLALEICTNCPGTDLLEKEDVEILFRYCSFASLWMDSAWISATAKMDRVDRPADKTPSTKSNDNDPLTMFIDHFQDVIGSELSRIQLDVIEYSALKSFCIWKLGILDSTLTLKIVAQEQFLAMTQALRKHYLGAKGMEEFEMATRLADITLMLGSIFNIYQSVVQLYATLGIPSSIDTVSI